MPNGHGFSYPYGFSILVQPVLAVAIAAGAGRWWSYALVGAEALLVGVFVWEAVSRSEYEKIRANDPGTTRYSWVINWLTFFALPALIVLVGSVAAYWRRG